MAHARSLRWWRHPLALALLALPAAAAAQISPTTPAHPNLPWGGGIATPQGQLIRFIYCHPSPSRCNTSFPACPRAHRVPSPARRIRQASRRHRPPARRLGPRPPGRCRRAPPATPDRRARGPRRRAPLPTPSRQARGRYHRVPLPTPDHRARGRPPGAAADAAPPTPGPAPSGADVDARPRSATADAKPPEDTPVAESAPPTARLVNQQVTIPGYYVRETTAGFHYPERWAIEQVGPNTYRWFPSPLGSSRNSRVSDSRH